MQKSIYVAEDDENIRDLVRIALESCSYNVYTFETAEETIEKIYEQIPDLIIFDIMLPGISGIDAVKSLRSSLKYQKIPIIMLTAKTNEVDKIIGLDSGADDYITKPFSIMELMARVRSLLRRSNLDNNTSQENSRICFNNLVMDINAREVFINDKLIALTFKEYELLKYLIENKNRVVSRNELLNNVWGYDYTGETRTIDIHIRNLRQKINVSEEFIKTIRGMGYRFNENFGSDNL